MALPCWVAGLGRPALKDVLGSCSAREMSPHTQRSLQSKAESESEVTQSCPTLCDPMVVAYQLLPSMGFSRQEYWSGLPFLLQEIFTTQGLNLGLPHCRWTLYRLRHQGSLEGRPVFLQLLLSLDTTPEPLLWTCNKGQLAACLRVTSLCYEKCDRREQ